MALKKIKLPDNSVVEVQDSRISGVDSTPTSESANVVTSGGVYNALADSRVTGKIYRGTCSTAAATAAKVVVCPEFSSDALIQGAAIFVTFSTTNSAAVADLTMNVNSTGAKGLKKIYNATTRANLTSAGELRASQTYLFVYDGTAWVCLSMNYNSTYSALSQTDADTGTATTGRLITAKVLATTIANKIAGKQDIISDLADIRAGAAAGATAYQKPSSGILESDLEYGVQLVLDSAVLGPLDSEIFGRTSEEEITIKNASISKAKLSSAVQTSLGKADTALQSYTETDPTVPAWAKAASKPSYTAQEVGALPSTTVIPAAPGTLNTTATTAQTTSSSEALSGSITLHKVSKTGSYEDLTNKPTIPAAQVQSDWNATSGMGVILNKPTIPSAPGTLNTNNSTAQTASSSEALSGTIKLHKVSKTGSYSDLLSKPTIPTISLNGSSTTSASFYAPTAAGTSGQVLTSNGSGAPTWADPSGGGGNIFIATYGTTTLQDIFDAYNGGATVFCAIPASGAYGQYQTSIAPLIRIDQLYQYVAFLGGDKNTRLGLAEVITFYTNDVNNGWASANYAPSFQRERSIATSIPSGGFVSNTIYDLGTISTSTTFSIKTSGVTTSICNEWIWSFSTGSTAPSITWPSSIKWEGEGGTAPAINSNCLYEISVRRIGSTYVGYYKETEL